LIVSQIQLVQRSMERRYGRALVYKPDFSLINQLCKTSLMIVQMPIVLYHKIFKAWWLFIASYAPEPLGCQLGMARDVGLTSVYNAATASLQGHRR